MKLIEKGDQVSRPIGTTYRYDLIAEKHPKYYRIQVKNLRLAYSRDPEEPLSIDQWEIRAYTIANGKKKTYSIEDTDLIFAINIETHDFAIIPVDCIPASGIVKISQKTKRGCYLNSFLALDNHVTSGDTNRGSK